jgi:hypothetical protein
MATTQTSANAIRVGPGALYAAPMGTDEPDGPSGAWPSAWVPLGLTTDGSTDTLDRATADVVAAELFEPVATYTTSQTETIAFTLLNLTARNLQMALNGGLTAPTATDGFVSVEQPNPGEELRIMLGWDAADGKERSFWRKCVQVGSIAIARQKAPNASTVPCSFRSETPADGSKPRQQWVAEEFAV